MTHIENTDRPTRLYAEQRIVDNIRVVSFRGEIDHDVTDVLGEALCVEDDAQQPRIAADLSKVTFMVFSGISPGLAPARSADQSIAPPPYEKPVTGSHPAVGSPPGRSERPLRKAHPLTGSRVEPAHRSLRRPAG